MATDAPRTEAALPLAGAPPAAALAAALESAALERAGGTVTSFLEGLFGERIDADVVAQGTGEAGPHSGLGLDPSAPLLRRAALLTGRDTGRVFAYAESRIATGRLPHDAVRRLHGCREPIGRILVEQGLEPRRELLDGTPEADAELGTIGALLSHTALARRSVIVVASEPVVLVSEWFLDPVTDALKAPGR